MKKNSLAVEIVKTSFKVGFISLLVFALSYVLLRLLETPSPSAFAASVVASVTALILLSIILPSKTAERIAKRINSRSLTKASLASSYKELEEFNKKIIEREKETEKMLDELRENHFKQDAMRRDFTANVSHELKTPLTSIKGYSELLKSGMVKEEDVSRFAGKIYDEAHRLITLVGDIIKLSQLDGNEVQVKFEALDLYELTEAVIGQFEMVAKEKKIEISLSGDKATITAPEQIVEEMIFNVIDNAVKYNKE
ncbi:MAG: hypothetical protein IIV81_00080, partial [Clostridia bacterium]|nr:hypothetical protein [Clostridia bacterium]